METYFDDFEALLGDIPGASEEDALAGLVPGFDSTLPFTTNSLAAMQPHVDGPAATDEHYGLGGIGGDAALQALRPGPGLLTPSPGQPPPPGAAGAAAVPALSSGGFFGQSPESGQVMGGASSAAAARHAAPPPHAASMVAEGASTFSIEAVGDVGGDDDDVDDGFDDGFDDDIDDGADDEFRPSRGRKRPRARDARGTDKRQQQREKNRQSAQEYRKKRRERMESLERRVRQLEQENATLKVQLEAAEASKEPAARAERLREVSIERLREAVERKAPDAELESLFAAFRTAAVQKALRVPKLFADVDVRAAAPASRGAPHVPPGPCPPSLPPGRPPQRALIPPGGIRAMLYLAEELSTLQHRNHCGGEGEKPRITHLSAEGGGGGAAGAEGGAAAAEPSRAERLAHELDQLEAEAGGDEPCVFLMIARHLKLAREQKLKLLDLSPRLRALDAAFVRASKLSQQARAAVEEMLKGYMALVDEASAVLSTKQRAEYFMWIQANPAFLLLLYSRWKSKVTPR